MESSGDSGGFGGDGGSKVSGGGWRVHWWGGVDTTSG